MALCSAAETTILPPIRILFHPHSFFLFLPKLPFFFFSCFARKPPLKVVSERCARSRGMHESPDPIPRLAARSKKLRPAWSLSLHADAQRPPEISRARQTEIVRTRLDLKRALVPSAWPVDQAAT